MPALVMPSSPWEWIGNTWSWVFQHLQAFETLGVIVAAVLALLALVLEARRRRLDQFLQLTDVSAWAEPVGAKPTVEEGVNLSVRNGTGQALQQVQVWIWPREVEEPRPVPISVPLIPPHDTRTFEISGRAVSKWDARMHHFHFLVAIAFQDAKGRWWWRLPNGRMLRHQPVKLVQEPQSRSEWFNSPGWPVWWLSFRTRAVRRFKRAAAWRPK
ncbi:hypothetical protein ACFT2C_09125 [Promicromonospora sp. NPDC057138]|uniref:hypothetical protein n=1 Tax=Promicromonospora sp. NPDC057138 TaxID=3346031 RepID=UPI0036382DBF